MGRGQLSFKGDKPKKKKKTKSAAKHETKQKTNEEPVVVVAASPSTPASSAPAPPRIQKGRGLITSSGTVVMGQETKFVDDRLSVGDAILVHIDGRQEMRVITMCLSNTSLNLSSGFSRSVVEPTEFEYICKPKPVARNSSAGNSKAATKLKEDANASGLYGGNDLVYREKTETGSYRFKREKVTSDLTRTQLLEIRAKKRNDKYC